MAVEASDGRVDSALAGILFFGCAEGAVRWQRISAVKK